MASRTVSTSIVTYDPDLSLVDKTLRSLSAAVERAARDGALTSATVSLVDGTSVGTVTEVQANPASDLLVLDTGALVPVVFITEHGGGTLTIDPPEGLFDL